MDVYASVTELHESVSLDKFVLFFSIFYSEVYTSYMTSEGYSRSSGLSAAPVTSTSIHLED